MDDAPVDLDALEKLLAEATSPPEGYESWIAPVAALEFLNQSHALLREVRRLMEEEAQRQDIVCALNDGCVRYEKEIATLRAGLKEACEIARTALVCKLDDSGDTDAYHADVARLRALAEGRGVMGKSGPHPMTTKAAATLIYELTFATAYQRDGFRRNFGDQFAPAVVVSSSRRLLRVSATNESWHALSRICENSGISYRLVSE